MVELPDEDPEALCADAALCVKLGEIGAEIEE